MTQQQIEGLEPATAGYLRRFRRCFHQDQTAKHLDTYCRGPLTDLARKTVEPMAFAAETAVRTSRRSRRPSSGPTRPPVVPSTGNWRRWSRRPRWTRSAPSG